MSNIIMSSSKASQTPSGIKWWVVVIIFLAVVVTWACSWVYLKSHYAVSNDAGSFGDMFGFVNSLFSGLAFAGIIITILLQREELKAQREELKLNTEALIAQKDELKAQREEFEKQNRNLEKQSFEITFFNSLNAKDTVVTGLNNSVDKYFETRYGELDKLYKAESNKTTETKIRSFFYNHEWQLGHYFRSIVTILKFINSEKMSDQSMNLYISLLHARMSNDELRLFFYNIISELIGDVDDVPGTLTWSARLDLKSLIKKYDFFNVIRPRLAVGLIDQAYDWEMLRRLIYEDAP